MKKALFITAIGMAATGSLCAQDTSRRHEVTVTASYQPVLKEAAKINFNATPPPVDSSRPQLQYKVPNQNLLFAYQPGTLKPMALSADSILRWDNWNYIKAGFGTQNTPYLETGLSIGDATKAGVNVYGNYFSSKGKLPYQQVHNGQLDALGHARLGSNHEITARIGLRDEQYYQYGYRPDSLVFLKDSLSNHYTTFRSRIALRNINRTAYGISYAPELRVDAFSDNRNNSETNTYIYLPLRKSIEGRFEVELAAEGQLTGYHSALKTDQNSNWFQLSPSLFIKTVNAFVQAGIRPSWDNGVFKLMPNILAEIGTADKSVAVIAGWTGRLRANSYQYLAGFNPWVTAPATISNSRIQQVYGGVRGTVADHFTYLVRGGLNLYSNTPVFLNEGPGGKSFGVENEPDLRAINIHGEVGYSVGDRFTLRSVLDATHFVSLDNHDEAYGLPQFEFNTALRLQVLRDLYAKADIIAFDGVHWSDRINTGTDNGGFDVSAGLEFNVYKNIKIWGQFNNLLNQRYERWHQYPNYGFQFIGGIVFSFAQTRK